jgi:hypothetical protein
MRKKRDTQGWLDFQPSRLQLTNEYFGRYEQISVILEETPKLLHLVHLDLELALDLENREAKRRGGFVYTSEMVLRLCLCQVIEGSSLREIVVRVDDSHYLRRFTRIHGGPMMNHATFCKLRNAIQPETWKKLNAVLAKASFERGRIYGEKLRLDTTAVETNIHWPTDSSLLWDAYRTLGRLIGQARELDPGVALHARSRHSLRDRWQGSPAGSVPFRRTRQVDGERYGWMRAPVQSHRVRFTKRSCRPRREPSLAGFVAGGRAARAGLARLRGAGC